ncbi:hypothetical protein [Nocardioides sp.]|uniref:hypothetical protein n=1 Tax=Nocardioides sp. TaxID=35761 RepID=UPI0025D7AAA1|nr:hypothetical protein [Nocardioides sp.]
MHSKLRIGGLAAVVSATTLVLPLFAMGAAQAAATADLTITKTVSVAKTGTIIEASDFIPALSDTSGAATVEFTDSGLHVTTADNAAHAAEHWALDAPMPSAVTLNWTGPAPKPGSHIMFDVDHTFGNGNDYNVLVGEDVYGGDFWYTGGTTRAATRGITCPSTAAGSGSDCHGTLAQWKTAVPNGHMYAAGFSLGTGAVGNGYITSMTYDSTRFDFGGFASSVQAAPGSTVEYKLTVTNSGSAAMATSVVVTDTLPADLTYVSGSLVDNGNGCAFVAKTLTCNAGSFPPGISTTIKFKAKLSSTVTSNGLQPKVGHIVDVQKQEVFANLPANGLPQTFNVMCPAGYTPTDGGLLLDAVDQGGYYSDIVTSVSKPINVSGIDGWTVSATNLGEERGQGKVKVTCLGSSTGSSDGHSHAIQVVGSDLGSGTISAFEGTDTVTRTCPTGYTPIAPQFTVTSGIAVMRTSIAAANTWKWTVDHEAGAAVTFGLSCLAPQAQASNGHMASLGVSTQSDTLSLAPETRDEGVQQCLPESKAITGGYEGMDENVLSLGKEQRGNNYMFRFYNDDWELAHNAKIQVTCVADRTPDEPRYYHVTNTATVQSPDDPSASSSSADIAVVGDPVDSVDGVMVGGTGSRTGWPVKKVNITVTCISACAFTVKVIKNGDVVAKATKSFSASPAPRPVAVPTTSAGKHLNAGQVTVKVKTADDTVTKTVTLS